MKRTLKMTGIALAAVAVAGAVAALFVRDQLERHRRELFSPYPLKRLACLGHLAREEASVLNINLLRDFVSWEPKRLLRNRGRVILKRMEDQALEEDAGAPGTRG
ncbi:MAG: hypothetical protein ACQET1_05135 [Gemmatimonadota bacterium]